MILFIYFSWVACLGSIYPKKLDAALAYRNLHFFSLASKNQGKNHDMKGDSSK